MSKTKHKYTKIGNLRPEFPMTNYLKAIVSSGPKNHVENNRHETRKKV